VELCNPITRQAILANLIYDLPLRPAGAIEMTLNFFSLADFWLLFGTLKGPNGFLAFLVPRLGPKKLEIRKSFKSIEKGRKLFFGLTFEPETLATQSRALKTRILP